VPRSADGSLSLGVRPGAAVVAIRPYAEERVTAASAVRRVPAERPGREAVLTRFADRPPVTGEGPPRRLLAPDAIPAR
jgi:hypothetical protein